MGCRESIVGTDEEDRKTKERSWSKWDIILDIRVEKNFSVYDVQFDIG